MTMTIMNPQVELGLRKAFKTFNHFMILLWKLGLGSLMQFIPQVTGRIMVITHIGRKTGLKYHTPANYAIIGDDIYCTAAFGTQADWYLNIVKNPTVEVWLPEGWWQGTAEDVSNADNRIEIMRQVLISSGFATYLFGINPHMPDEKLSVVTSSYRLLRIHREEAATGKDGPGGLSWIWPLATFLLLPLALRRCKKK